MQTLDNVKLVVRIPQHLCVGHIVDSSAHLALPVDQDHILRVLSKMNEALQVRYRAIELDGLAGGHLNMIFGKNTQSTVQTSTQWESAH